MNPFFSIIIPTYNRAHLLPIAIESVLNQTFTNWELVIVDDGSTDNTKAVVESFNDDRIKYIWQENKERSAASNNGIGQSKGTYICFLDSDDYYLNNRLELFHYEILERNSPKALFYTGICFKNGDTIIKQEEEPNIYKSMMDYIVYNVIGNPQVCVHYQILEQHKYNEQLTISEDMELWIRILDAGYSFIFLNNYTIVAVNHLGRSVSNSIVDSHIKMLDVLNFIFKKPHPGNAISNSMKRFVYSINYYGQAKYHISKNKKKEALQYLFYSIFMKCCSPQTKHKLFLMYKILFTSKKECNNLMNLIG